MPLRKYRRFSCEARVAPRSKKGQAASSTFKMLRSRSITVATDKRFIPGNRLPSRFYLFPRSTELAYLLRPCWYQAARLTQHQFIIKRLI
jgi:hypothetical protein